MSNIIEIFCDGGCRGNGKDINVGAWAAILSFGEYNKEVYGAVKNTTNNRMEITAVIEALTQIMKCDIPVVVNCDSAYVVNAFNDKWIDNWKKNGWKNSKRRPVENRDLWEELIRLVEKFKDIRFQKVKGHAGVDGNERVDELCNQAMDDLE